MGNKIHPSRIAESLPEYAANPDSYESIRDVPAGIAVRLPGFAELGIDGNLLVEAVREAGPELGPATPGWAGKMMLRGDAMMARAGKSETSGDTTRARDEYLEASFWYFFARFPHIMNPEGADAYQRHIAAYKRAARHFDGSFEELAIPFEPAPLTAYLRIPAQAKGRRVPVVVIWGGIDVWKAIWSCTPRSKPFCGAGLRRCRSIPRALANAQFPPHRTPSESIWRRSTRYGRIARSTRI